MGDFAVAEKADEWHVTDFLRDCFEFCAIGAKHGRTAGNARIVDGSTGLAGRAIAHVIQHPNQVIVGALGIAPTEHQARPFFEVGGNSDQAALGIQAQKVTHEIIGLIGTRDRQSGMDVSTDPAQIVRKKFANVFLEDVKGGASIDAYGHVALA